MKVEKGAVVGIDYKLHLGDGEVIDESAPGEPLAYIHGEGQIVPGLERQLEGMDVGQSKQVVVSPSDGYGDHDPAGIQQVPSSAFPPGVNPQPGMRFMAQAPDGMAVPVEVKSVAGDAVTIDLNHPLAGKTLHFDVTVREVRAATPDELEHGHAHGPGAHGHD